MSSTTHELARRYRVQVEAEFRKTKSQTTDETKEGRSVQLKHLRKLYAKVQGRSSITLKTEGLI